MKDIKNNFIYWCARGALFIVARLPVALRDRIGTAIGLAALCVATRERRIADRQLAYAFPGLSPRRAEVLIRGIARHVGRNAAEMAALTRPGARLPEIGLSDRARAALDSALAQDRGVVYVTGHMGNWEMMAAWLAAEGYPIHTVVSESYDPRFTALIDTTRRRLGIQTIFRGSAGAAAAMLRALRRGAILGFLIDQDTRVPSIFVPFFGRAAKTAVGPARLAARCRAPVVVGTIHRQLGGVHRIEIEQCPLPPTVEAATEQMSRCLEARIRKHPSQWVWFHRRWRSRPEEGAR